MRLYQGIVEALAAFITMSAITSLLVVREIETIVNSLELPVHRLIQATFFELLERVIVFLVLLNRNIWEILAQFLCIKHIIFVVVISTEPWRLLLLVATHKRWKEIS